MHPGASRDCLGIPNGLHLRPHEPARRDERRPFRRLVPYCQARGPTRPATFQTISQETVWKFGIGPEIGVPKAVERGQRGPDQPLLTAEEARSRGLGLFSKQFLK